MRSIKRPTVSHFLLASAGLVIASTMIISRNISISSAQLVEIKRQERRILSSVASSINTGEDRKRLAADISGGEDTFTMVARKLTAQGLKISVARTSTVAADAAGDRHSDIQFSVAGDYLHLRQALGLVMVERSAVALDSLRITKQRGSNMVLGELQFSSYTAIR